MVFVNTYNSDTTLTITKEVAGNFADQDKDFTYTINITGASGGTVDARHIAADGTSTIRTINVASGIFTLQHGEKIIFESLPINATYNLTETEELGYTATATVQNGSGLIGVEIGLAANVAVSVGNGNATTAALQSAIAITSGSNIAAWINTYDTITPTGVLMNVLPFIILILVAIGGFAGFIVMKRRKPNHR